MTDRAPAPRGRAGFQLANDESRVRLALLVARLTPTDMRVDLGEGWTVASALAHAGFWDRWQAARWEEMLAGKWSADDDSVLASEHLANEALHPYWAGVSAEDVPALALEAAEHLDALIASAPDDLVDAIEGTPSAYLLHRHRHRGEHMDHIERGLAAAGRAPRAMSGEPDRSYDERNSASRERLMAVVSRLKPADLTRRTDPSEEGSWTIGQVLGHLAFWDRFLASRWRAALSAGGSKQPGYLPDDLADMLNSALEPSLAALAASSGPSLLTEVAAASREVDELISRLPAEAQIDAVLAERPRLLDRSFHRHSHLDSIEVALGR
jgi:hypothetical protein